MKLIESKVKNHSTYYLDRLPNGTYTIERDGIIIHTVLTLSDARGLFYQLTKSYSE